MKTIRLPSHEYRLIDGRVEVLKGTFDSSTDEDSWDWHDTRYAIGAQAVLVSATDVSPNAIRAGNSRPHYYLHWDLDGVPGNSNPHIKSTTGWRGTTGNRCVDAHGVVTIRKIRQLKSGDIAVSVS